MYRVRVLSLSLCAILVIAGCVSKPEIVPHSDLAPEKVRCPDPAMKLADSDINKRECKGYLDAYLEHEPRFTCSNGANDRCNPRTVLPWPGSDYFSVERLNAEFGNERGLVNGRTMHSAAPPYELGVALAGGGTRAADYSIGILAGLHDPGNRSKAGHRALSERVDALSSVSGGTYAAVWYFSRIIDEYQISGERLSADAHFENVFADCLPTFYRALAAPDGTPASAADPVLCPPGAAQFPAVTAAGSVSPVEGNDISVASSAAACEAEPTKCDMYRFQNHLRGFHTPFDADFTIEQDGDKGLWGSVKRYSRAAREVALSSAVAPINLLANGLVDTELPLSVSGYRYFEGLRRTYSSRPVDCGLVIKDLKKALGTSPPAFCVGDKGRPAPNDSAAGGQTMAALNNLYYGELNKATCDSARRGLPHIPLWIANTTAGVDGRWFEFADGGEFEDAIFEFTPYGFGSRHYGRWIGTPLHLELSEIGGASGAFLDGQQRTLHPYQNALAELGLRSINQNWGISIPNPRLRDVVRKEGWFMPFPLYWLARHPKSNDAAWIHLSDGGQTDNTGVWSLVRRGTRTIILADNGNDSEGRFDDLCALRHNLARHKLYLHLPELTRFETDVCPLDEKLMRKKVHYNLWAWQRPILDGCINTDPDDTACRSEAAPIASPVKSDVSSASSSGQAPTPPVQAAGFSVRLFVVKPAIDLDTLAPALQKCDPASLDQPPSPAGTGCRQALHDLRTQVPRPASAEARAPADMGDFPAELFGFLVRTFGSALRDLDAAGGAASGPGNAPSLRLRGLDHDTFPQNSTVWTTLHSSAALFGAYRELARWQVRNLESVLSAPPDPARACAVPLVDGNTTTEATPAACHAGLEKASVAATAP